MHDIMEYLKNAAESGASDLFLIAGAKAAYRIDGRMDKRGDRLQPCDTDELVQSLYNNAGREMSRFQSEGDDDFSFSVPGAARFRINVYRQRGSASMVIRVVPFGIPDPAEAHVPDAVMSLAGLREGLVLVTGTAGSGKSTTQACIIDAINKDRDDHIVTLEDPIEYLHQNAEGIVSQREIGIDTANYLTGLRACLREAPDVILLGEMRDAETIQTAMTAAETGHLVLATLHTKGAANAVDRMIDSFPSGQQAQARAQMAMVVDTIVSQELLPKTGGGRVPACEILKFTPAVRSLVRDGKTHQLDAAMANGIPDGMVPMSHAVSSLLSAGLIDQATAAPYLHQDVQGQDRCSAFIGTRPRNNRKW